MSDGVSEPTPGDLWSLIEELVARVEALRRDVTTLKSARSASTSAVTEDRALRRTLPGEGELVDLDVLAEWVESLVVRYGASGDWLRPCWWRHGFVVEELAALRVAWLAVYDASEPIDPTAGIRWHDEAERCRERIRRTIKAGPGCTGVTHKPDEPVTNDPRWSEESAALHDPYPATRARPYDPAHLY